VKLVRRGFAHFAEKRTKIMEEKKITAGNPGSAPKSRSC